MAEPMEKPFFKGIIVVKRLSAIGLALVKFKGSSCFAFTQSQWIKLVKNQNSPTTDNENIGNKSSSCLDFDDCPKNLLELSWKAGSDGRAVRKPLFQRNYYCKAIICDWAGTCLV